jgi:hypothetical protein
MDAAFCVFCLFVFVLEEAHVFGAYVFCPACGRDGWIPEKFRLPFGMFSVYTRRILNFVDIYAMYYEFR